MSDRPLHPVQALIGVWAKWSKQPDFPYGPDHCLNGARVAIEVLRNFGVLAKPVSVRMMVFNRFAFELWTDGVYPKDWPEHAWSVGVASSGARTDDRWDGHLLCETVDWTLDISAGQFHRPGKIEMPGPVLLPVSLPPTGDVALTDAHGQVIVIARSPENNGWRTARGWDYQHNVPVIKAVTERVAAAIAADEQATVERNNTDARADTG